MNTLDRRLLIKHRVIDAVVVKAAYNQSRRERMDAARKLRKALAAKRYAVKRDAATPYSHSALS